MALNPSKCKLMVFCFARHPPPPPVITIGPSQLEVVQSARVLGVILQHDLKWTEHVTTVVGRGSKRLYVLRNLKKHGLETSDLILIFIGFVRPVLEYACVLWHPGLTRELSLKIERVQKRALRTILGNDYTDYQSALNLTGLSRLDARRQELCLRFATSLVNSEKYQYNVARGKIATQSSTVSYDNRVQEGPEKAVDGSTDGCARTSFEFQPWWKVDLAGYYAVNRVSVPFLRLRNGVKMAAVETVTLQETGGPLSATLTVSTHAAPQTNGVETVQLTVTVQIVSTTGAQFGTKLRTVRHYDDGMLLLVAEPFYDFQEDSYYVKKSKEWRTVLAAGCRTILGQVPNRPGQGTEPFWARCRTVLDGAKSVQVPKCPAVPREYGATRTHVILHENEAPTDTPFRSASLHNGFQWGIERCCIFFGYPLMVRVGPNEDFTRNDQCGLKYTDTLTGPQSFVMHCDPPLPGRYVSIQMIERKAALDLCEVEVYATDICCDETIGIANGQITANDGFCFGEKIQFSCNPGYELVGDSWTTCQKNGSWAREVPTSPTGTPPVAGSPPGQICDVIDQMHRMKVCGICCDNTTEITNGLVNATDGYCFGNDISFSCNPGYELVGTPLTTCQEDGSWSREIPTCQPHAQTVPEEQSMEATIAGASASVVAVLIVVSAVLMVLLRRRRRKRKDSTVQVSYFLPDDVIIHNRRLQELAAAPPVPDRPELPGFEVDPSRVTLGQRIGSGAFGLAYRATLTTGDETEDVVVKTLKDATSEEDRLSFLEEIRAVVALGVQDNVMGLVGCCTVVRDHLYLITEFMPYGDLKNFLRKCRQEEIYDEPRGDIYNFEVKQMYQVARQIARGMVLLTQQVPQMYQELQMYQLLQMCWVLQMHQDHISRSRYIHGDLAARNVLVGEELKVKISDFGLAEDIYTRGYRRQDRLQRVPWKWMAPERLEDGKAYTSQSDVWSFGIVLYEISTLGGDPYPDVAIAHLKDRLQAGFRMPKPESCPPGMYDLMLQCWRWQPAERPSFRNLELDLDSQLAFYGPEYARTAPATGTVPKPTA
ncbi:Leucine-rich repeat-containing protein 15 [Branchiostoma belcheri]|nr:Leucine-rich repeat-containing protein 15 [Branchiostoma belcheri]